MIKQTGDPTSAAPFGPLRRQRQPADPQQTGNFRNALLSLLSLHQGLSSTVPAGLFTPAPPNPGVARTLPIAPPAYFTGDVFGGY